MEIVTKIAPIVLALIMLGLGLGLSIKDFTRILKTPRDFIVGFLSQLILLPIVALIIALSLNLPSAIAVGLMIIAAAPGGVTSNVLTKFANGDVALSISLTAVTSLICIISIPISVINSANILGVTIAKEISVIGIALKMALVVTVPVIIGMIIRKLADSFVSSNINKVNKITGFLFLIAVIPATIGYYYTGVFLLEMVPIAIFCAVFAVIGMRLGRYVRLKINAETFKKVLLCLFFIIGVRLISSFFGVM